MTAVSVVVPIYNSEGWLPRFFISLREQTLQDFELLMVDDASTDGSAVQIEKEAAKDSRIRLVRLPENSGAGVARNVGIREAVGETLCFADPDDLLPRRSLEVRYTAYKKHKAIVRACHDEIGDNGNVLHNHEIRPERLPEVFSPAHEAHRVSVSRFLCAHWTWLFPTGLLRRYNIQNGVGMRTAEDIILLNRLFFHISRMVWIPDTVYYWMKRDDSLSTTHYTAEHYKNYFQCCEIFYEEASNNGQIALGDDFFNDYLAIYPSHLLWQAAQGLSDERDAREVIKTMIQISEQNKTLQRNVSTIQKKPSHYAGISRLWTIFNSQESSYIARLIESQKL